MKFTETERRMVDILVSMGSTTHEDLAVYLYNKYDYYTFNRVKVLFHRVRKKLEKLGVNIDKERTGHHVQIRYFPQEREKLHEVYRSKIVEPSRVWPV